MINCPLNTAGCDADIHVIVKIESADSIPNLHSIITASDGVLILILMLFPYSYGLILSKRDDLAHFLKTEIFDNEFVLFGACGLSLWNVEPLFADC